MIDGQGGRVDNDGSGLGENGWIWAAAVVAVLAFAAAAGAMVVNASFTVHVTVVETCRIIPGVTKGCAPSATPSTIRPPQPVVRYTRDPKTGATVETLEF
jgi:hypothetical protein